MHLANKLSKPHVRYHNQKIKVKYAVQVLSKSVATAIDYCRDVLKLKQFSDSECTTEFLRKMDTIFNVMNSSCGPNARDSKAPLSADNKESWLKGFDETEMYIYELSDATGKAILDGRRKTGFLGVLSNIQALKQLYLNLVDSEKMRCIPTRKLSQDHLGIVIKQNYYIFCVKN